MGQTMSLQEPTELEGYVNVYFSQHLRRKVVNLADDGADFQDPHSRREESPLEDNDDEEDWVIRPHEGRKTNGIVVPVRVCSLNHLEPIFDFYGDVVTIWMAVQFLSRRTYDGARYFRITADDKKRYDIRVCDPELEVPCRGDVLLLQGTARRASPRPRIHGVVRPAELSGSVKYMDFVVRVMWGAKSAGRGDQWKFSRLYKYIWNQSSYSPHQPRVCNLYALGLLRDLLQDLDKVIAGDLSNLCGPLARTKQADGEVRYYSGLPSESKVKLERTVNNGPLRGNPFIIVSSTSERDERCYSPGLDSSSTSRVYSTRATGSEPTGTKGSEGGTRASVETREAAGEAFSDTGLQHHGKTTDTVASRGRERTSSTSEAQQPTHVSIGSTPDGASRGFGGCIRRRRRNHHDTTRHKRVRGIPSLKTESLQLSHASAGSPAARGVPSGTGLRHARDKDSLASSSQGPQSTSSTTQAQLPSHEPSHEPSHAQNTSSSTQPQKTQHAQPPRSKPSHVLSTPSTTQAQQQPHAQSSRAQQPHAHVDSGGIRRVRSETNLQLPQLSLPAVENSSQGKKSASGAKEAHDPVPLPLFVDSPGSSPGSDRFDSPRGNKPARSQFIIHDQGEPSSSTVVDLPEGSEGRQSVTLPSTSAVAPSEQRPRDLSSATTGGSKGFLDIL